MIREARPDELDAAGAVVAEAYLRRLRVAATHGYLDEIRDARGRAAVCPVLGRRRRRRARSWARVTYVPDHENPFAETELEGEAGFRMLGVDPAARGRGIGERLAAACVERARAAGMRGASRSRPTTAMHAAHRLYARMGFRRDPSRDFEPDPRRPPLHVRARPHGAGVTVAGPVPRPAATVAILRDAPGGPEVLLTHRPPTMAFGPGLHVFPGGALDDADADPSLLERLARPLAGRPGRGPRAGVRRRRDPRGVGGVRDPARERRAAWPASRRRPMPTGPGFGELVLARDLLLRGDWLVPLSRWVTPPVVPRRYDARFFVAWLPDGSVPSFHGGEVVAHEWIAPLAALDAMADGRIELWMPTSATLQQLAGVRSRDGPARAGAARAGGGAGRARRRGDGRARDRARGRRRGRVPGDAGRTWVVGDRACVVVDPGDPSDEAAEAVLAVAAARGARVVAVLVSSSDPACAAGGEGMALRLGVPLLGPAAAGSWRRR